MRYDYGEEHIDYLIDIHGHDSVDLARLIAREADGEQVKELIYLLQRQLTEDQTREVYKMVISGKEMNNNE